MKENTQRTQRPHHHTNKAKTCFGIERGELLCPPDSLLPMSSLIPGVAKTAEASSFPVPPLLANCMMDAPHAFDRSKGITRGGQKEVRVHKGF